MDKRKIAFILPSLRAGGAERVTINLLGSNYMKQFDIKLILINEIIEYDVPKHIELRCILRPHDKKHTHILKIMYFLCRYTRDVHLLVGALELTATYLSALLSKVYNIPVIGWVHTDLKSFFTQINSLHPHLVKLTYPHLSQVIAVSKRVKDSVIEVCPQLKDKIVVIHNPNNITLIRKQSQEKFIFTKKHPLLVAVGTLNKNKGFDLLIKACKQLYDSGIYTNLVILGEGLERYNLQALVEQLNMGEHIFLYGYCSNPYVWMKNADIVVQSSWLEGLPTILIEALAVNTPVIATDSEGGGAREILKDGEYGMLARVGNINSLSESIRRMLSDHNLRNSLKEKGYKRAIDFDYNKTVPKFIEQINDLIGVIP